MATIYEVCAIVITILLGVLGFELALMLHSARRLAEEARQTLENVNVQLPSVLDNARAVSQQVRDTSERVSGTLLEVVKDGFALWLDIRKRKGRQTTE